MTPVHFSVKHTEQGHTTYQYQEIAIQRLDPEYHTFRYVGDVAVEICVDCLATTTYCLHTIDLWNKEGTALTCKLCGEEGT